MAHPTVLARIKALEAAGVIQGYTASISLKKVGYPVKMMFLVGAGRLSGDDVERVQRYIEKEPSFLHAGTVCGDNDLFVFGHFADHEEAVEKASAFRNFLSKNMDLRSFRSYNVWRTIKFRNALELR
jgi:DNA-binding Lrp family transcriptional regulator